MTPLDPDYSRIYTKLRCKAWSYGFACVLHGSGTRDLDLLLVPWEASAMDGRADQMMRQLAQSEGLHFSDGEKDIMKAKVDWSDRPHGRRSVTLYFPEFGDPRWVDVSVMPCLTKEKP